MRYVLHDQQVQRVSGRRVWRPTVFRLELAPASLLYPYSAGALTWGADGELALDSGVYEVGGCYLVVDGARGTFVSEAAAFEHLGATAALSALGLGDAAISLTLGDLTNARYQWLRHRDGL